MLRTIEIRLFLPDAGPGERLALVAAIPPAVVTSNTRLLHGSFPSDSSLNDSNRVLERSFERVRCRARRSVFTHRSISVIDAAPASCRRME